MQLAPGGALGRYELLMPLAQGGMATVWAARLKGSHGFEKTVAIKTALPRLSEDPQFETMFLNEARLAMRVSHPNVAQILDLGEAENVVYLVMEWIDGDAVSSLMKVADAAASAPAGKLPVGIPLRIALHICLKACAGLQAAHEVHDDDDRPIGIVHRDVSPQNIMVTFQGFVKVVDFGIAKADEQFVSTTRTGQFKGKVPYMSPEQASGGVVDRRTDIFALGTLLYRLTTGEHPFLGANDLATLHNLIYTPIDPPSAIVPDYPTGLEKTVLRAMDQDPAKRYATMAELAEDLETAVREAGPAVTEKELGAFMTKLLGDRRGDRKKQMREAAKSLGWAIATGQSLPQIGVNGIPIAHGLLTPSHPSRGALSSTSSTGKSVAGTIHSAPPPPPASRKGLFVGLMLAATLGGAAAAGVLFKLGGLKPSSSAAASQETGTAPVPTTTATQTSQATASAAQRETAVAVTPTAAPTTTATAATSVTARRIERPVPTARPTAAPTQWHGDGPDVGF